MPKQTQNTYFWISSSPSGRITEQLLVSDDYNRHILVFNFHHCLHIWILSQRKKIDPDKLVSKYIFGIVLFCTYTISILYISTIHTDDSWHHRSRPHYISKSHIFELRIPLDIFIGLLLLSVFRFLCVNWEHT